MTVFSREAWILILNVNKKQNGMTVLDILRSELGLSRGMIKHLIFLEGGITLNGESVNVRRVVSEGDILSLMTEDRKESGILPVELPLPILYEDGDVVVPDKPPFMPTHPSHDHYDDTVANALAFRYSDADEPYVFRPVNRLDRNTSGLLIIARNRIAAGRLYESMLKKDIEKKYIAVLDGVPSEECGVIDTYMRRTAESIIVREVCGECEGADRAITRYTVLRKSGTHSVVLAEPVTGRTHQLRVHFASIGCPIVGDDLYGNPSRLISRHALHAFSIKFPHPKDHSPMRLEAPIPEDMAELINILFPKEVQIDEKGSFKY